MIDKKELLEKVRKLEEDLYYLELESKNLIDGVNDELLANLEKDLAEAQATLYWLEGLENTDKNLD